MKEEKEEDLSAKHLTRASLLKHYTSAYLDCYPPRNKPAGPISIRIYRSANNLVAQHSEKKRIRLSAKGCPDSKKAWKRGQTILRRLAMTSTLQVSRSV